MTEKREPTTDAVEILDRMFYRGKWERQKELERCRVESDIAQIAYGARRRLGLSLEEVAAKIGATRDEIANIEEANCRVVTLTWSPLVDKLMAALDELASEKNEKGKGD